METALRSLPVIAEVIGVEMSRCTQLRECCC